MTARMAYPTESEIRSALIERMQAFCAASGIAPSMVCRAVMNDTNFFTKLVAGGNFTITTYQRLHTHFDQNWPNAPVERNRAPAKPRPKLKRAKRRKRANGKRRNGGA